MLLESDNIMISWRYRIKYRIKGEFYSGVVRISQRTRALCYFTREMLPFFSIDPATLSGAHAASWLGQSGFRASSFSGLNSIIPFKP
jgi:hypothetical protein